jgi:hypothetical protein
MGRVMTFDSTHDTDLDVVEAPQLGGSEGWSQVSFAMNSILQLSQPVFMRIDVDNHEPLFIDFRHNAFVWSTELVDFPTNPQSVHFETEVADPDARPLFRLPGQNLNSLLWLLGQHAYPGHAAPWLNPGERYRLAQWPNLARHLHELSQMHMLAILGNGYFSASELATMAEVPEADAHNLINALSLLRLLRVSENVPALVVPTPATEDEPEKVTTGLFARLRARLGR